MNVKLVLVIFMLAKTSVVRAQCTFNLRTFGIQQTSFASVNVLEDGYCISGWTLDTLGNSHYDLSLFRLAECGEIIANNHFGEPVRDFFGFQDCLSTIPNLYIQAGYGLRNDTASAFLVFYNELADTLTSFDFRSPFLNMGWEWDIYISPKSAVLTNDSILYMSTSLFHESTANDTRIYCFDIQGTELWHYDYATNYDPDQCFAICPYEDGVIGAFSKSVQGGDFEDLVEIIYLNENGEELWTINEPWEVNVADIQDIILHEGDMILAGSIAEYSDPDSLSKATLFRMTMDGELIWYNTASDYNEYAYRVFTNVVESIDGNFVCSGTHFTVLPDFTEEDGYVNKDGWLVKFNSETGEKMWERFYHFVVSQDDDHEIEDLKATPDGGVIFCGEATDGDTDDPEIEYPIQQGWVVKVDACGCLVPGCDEDCFVSVEESANNEKRNVYFKVGPNPATQFLNIYLPDSKITEFKDAGFELHDINGVLLTSFDVNKSNCTYMLDVEHYASGTYLLSLIVHGEVEESQRVMVE